MGQVIGDLYYTWPLLAVGAGATFVISLIWVVFLQKLAGCFVVFILIATNCILVGSAVWLYFHWQTSLGNYNTLATVVHASSNVSLLGSTTYAQYEQQASEVGFIVMAVIAGLVLIFTIAMGNRIKVAIQIIKEAGRALLRMPLIGKPPCAIILTN